MDFMIGMEGGYHVDHNGGDGRKPWMIMLVLQLFNAGSNLLYKMILNSGCHIVIVLYYRNIVAAFSIAPFAMYHKREMRRGLTWGELTWVAVCTFFAALCQVTVALLALYYGMRETTAAFASNIMNIAPVITFIISWSLRMEKLNFGSRAGKLKVLGTLISIGGAILSMTEYPIVNNLYGTILLLCASVANATGQFLQDKVLKEIPASYWMTTCMCIHGSFQTAVIGVFVNTCWDDWMLKDIQLFTILYSGFLNTAAAYFMISWVIPKRGYIYPSLFTSVSVFVTAIADCQMGEHGSFGSFLGMMIIIGGIHVYQWAKYNEEHEEQAELSQVDESASSEDIPEQVDESASIEDISETN